MESRASESLGLLRLVAAKQSLGLIQSWEIPPFANEVLNSGLYSDSLAELASNTRPVMSDVAPLLRAALAELQLEFPSKTEAAWYLANHCIRRIAINGEPPPAPLSLLQDVSAAAQDVLPNKAYVGDGLDLGSLIGIFWSYSAPNENYYEAEQRVIADESERQALLDTLAREECCRWLARHPS